MPLGRRSAILRNLSTKVLMGSPYLCFVARRVGTDISVSSSKKWIRKSFFRSSQFFMEPTWSFTNYSKANPLRLSMNKQAIIVLFNTTFPVWDMKHYICWFGEPLPSKVCKVGALNLGGEGTTSHFVGYGRTTPASWRLLRIVMSSRRFSSSFIFLEWLSPFFESSSSSNVDLGSLKLELSSLSVFSEVELSLSFWKTLVLTGRSAGLGTIRFLLVKQESYYLLEVIDRLLLDSKHILLLPLHSRPLFRSSSHLFWNIGHICESLLLYLRVGWLRLCNSRILLIYVDSSS